MFYKHLICFFLLLFPFSFTEFPEGPAPRDSRLTFHPEHEIPILRKWFKTCKTPSEEKLKYFANELNKGHVRQERPKLTVAKIKIWWKNERQRDKRQDKKQETETLQKSPDLKSNKNQTKTDQIQALLNNTTQSSASKLSITSRDFEGSHDSSSSTQCFTEKKLSSNESGTTRETDTQQNTQVNQLLPLPPEPSTGQFKSTDSHNQFLF